MGWQHPLRLDPGFVATFDYTTGSGRQARQFTFSMAHDGTPVILSPEHTTHRWITPEETDFSGLTAESRTRTTTSPNPAAACY